MFGRRIDGRTIRGNDPIVMLTPYIMPTRVDSQVSIRLNIDFDAMTRYIRKSRQDGHVFTYMGMILSAYVRMLSQYPELNRFIMNKRLYARNHICVSFVALKKNGDDQIEESLVKLEFNADDTIFDIHEKLDAAIAESRKPSAKNRTDVIARGLLAVPGLPTLVVAVARLLDRYGLMPSAIHKASPFHTSLFISNMASIGMNYIYHHIYNFGTTSVFVSMGNTEQSIRINADGSYRNRRVMPLGTVIDERICSGGLYSKAFGYWASCLSRPETLEEKPADVKYEIPPRKSQRKSSQINSYGD